jgi:electron transport complex protein RnfB
MVPTQEVAQAVAVKGGPPAYVEKNWDRLVSAAQTIAELAWEQSQATKK